MANESAVEGYVAPTVEQLGRVDLFVNNAGVERPRVPMVEVSTADSDRVTAVNARGVFLGLRAVMREMLRQGEGGAIRDDGIARRGTGGGPLQPLHRREARRGRAYPGRLVGGAPHGIRVNAAAPGHIDTRMARALAASLSDEVSYVSGATYLIDAGLNA